MILELLIVLVLVLVNGFLAMSELAIVSARASRLKVMAERRERGAQAALDLAAEPGRLLSAVQTGITLVGILSGAFSGATIGTRVSLWLAGLGVPAPDLLGVGAVVVAITYLSLIVGELVPKQIALRAPEKVAALVAPTMVWIARLTAPLVWLLDRSGRLLLAALGQSGGREADVSDEEVRLIIAEAETAGVIEEEERDMIAGVMRVADRSASGLMTPRRDVQMLDLSQSHRAQLKLLREAGHSRLPVHAGEPDTLLGVISVREALAEAGRRGGGDLRGLVREARWVDENLDALEVLDHLRDSPGHMVLVHDEHGQFEGIITPMDVLGAITGYFDHEPGEQPMLLREDGSLLVEGWMAADLFAEEVGLKLEPERDFSTVAGLLLDRLKHIPVEGERLQLQGIGFEVIDMDGPRIDKVLVTPRR